MGRGKKMLKTKEEHLEEVQKKEQLVQAGKNQIMEEYKNNLPQELDRRLAIITDNIRLQKEVEGLSSIEINEILRPHNVIGSSPKYSADQLRIIFDYYREALVMVNKKFKYPPSKENFCAFAGMSTSTYNKYLTSPNEEMQELMLMIDDYIRENMLTSAQIGETKEITTMFRGKTAHGMVEAQSPIVVEHRSETDISQINKMIEAVKAGKSLKSIELDKKDYKVED